MVQYLVADIGGTNARFGLADCQSNIIEVSFQQNFLCADFQSIDEMIRAYQQTIQCTLPEKGCFAIAGPVSGDEVTMTNVDWSFNIADIAKKVGMVHLSAINDFVGLANAAPYLKEQDCFIVKEGHRQSDAPMTILGPGTGFGVAALVPSRGQWVSVASEGGHAPIAGVTKKQRAIIDYLYKTSSFVSIEDLLCGQGLVKLYSVISALSDNEAEDLSPKDVTARGLSGEDPLCEESLQYFCAFLGAVVADKALTYGARGGVFLGGGILPRLGDFIHSTTFVEQFLGGGKMRGYLENIPVSVITLQNPALTGAAAWLLANT